MPSKSATSKPSSSKAKGKPKAKPKQNQLLISRFFNSSQAKQPKPSKHVSNPSPSDEPSSSSKPATPATDVQASQSSAPSQENASTKPTDRTSSKKPTTSSPSRTKARTKSATKTDEDLAAGAADESAASDLAEVSAASGDELVPKTRSAARAEAASAKRVAPSRRLFVDVDADDESEPEEPPSKRRRGREAEGDMSLGKTVTSHEGHNDEDMADAEAADRQAEDAAAATAADELRALGAAEDDGEASDKLHNDDEDYNCDSNDDDEGSDRDVASGEDSEEEKDEKMPQVDGSGRPKVTLMSYASARTTSKPPDAPTPPRDAKMRKRFTQKMGRLEEDSFFLRRTGGTGNSGNGPASTEDASLRQSKSKKGVKYTPLETQIVKLKKQYPDMLLVVECGYKYRMFDNDASEAARVLRVAAFFDHNFLTAGFPTHRLAHHVRRLVDAGLKVGVISQSETAALKKAGDNSSKLFERKLSAVYTKGTIAADGKLVGPASNGLALGKAATYIMAIQELPLASDGKATVLYDTRTVAIAAVDCATGEVFYDAFTDDVLRSDLESRLVAIEPVEVIVPKTCASPPTELAVKAYCDSTSARLERMKDSEFDNAGTVEGLRSAVIGNPDLPPLAGETVLNCLGALVSYLKQFNLELSMGSIMEYKTFRSSRQMKIGADVLRNFEVFGNSNNGSIDGSLIGLLNKTQTPFGARQMRQWVSHPLVNPEDIENRLSAVGYLRNMAPGAEGLQNSEPIETALSDLIASFAKMPDLEQGLTRISCRKCTPPELVKVLDTIEGVGRRIDRIKSLDPSGSFPRLLKKIFSTTPVVAKVLEDNVIEVLNRKEAGENKLADVFSQEVPASEILTDTFGADGFLEKQAELEEANDEVKEAVQDMARLLKKLRQKHAFPRWEWKKVAHEEYLLEVPLAKASKMPSSWVIVNQTKAVKRFRPAEALRGHERVQCARETQDAAAARCWQAYLELFSSTASSLRAVVRLLVDLDCLSALAQVANMPGYCKPEIECDEKAPSSIVAENARHPLTELLPSCKSYVPNDVSLGKTDDAIAMVISGPNYGGKSSYARMTALLVMLAQIGSFVPAKSARIRPFDAIHARMGSSDSIAKGMSSLMVELAETSRIISTGTKRSLVVLDELGRGTSTHDGAAIAYATLAHLVEKIGCVTLFVTHYPMLASLRSVFPAQVKACFMNYIEEPDDSCTPEDTEQTSASAAHGRTKITFLYKLADGVASSSYGLNVARLAGITPVVIDDAQVKAAEMESRLEMVKQESTWSQLMRDGTWSAETGERGLQLAGQHKFKDASS